MAPSQASTAGEDGRSERNYERSIFVGNIPFETTAQDIESMFGKEFRVVRADIVTNRGRSRGMATVEFESKDDVMGAISKYDRTQHGGREIFVRQDYPPPQEKRRDREGAEREGRETREKRTREGRDREGRDREGRERRDRDRDARDRDGRDRRDAEREERRQKREREPAPGTEVFVGNLPFSVTWQTLKDLMRSVGSVVRADVMTNKWGKSRGFGTVVFETPDEAAAAVEKFQGYQMEGRAIDIRPGRDQAPKPVLKNSDLTEGVVGNGEVGPAIYAANLPYITSQTDLFELFETIGRVVRAEIQYNAKGRPSGNAVVEFESAELATLAIQNLHGYNYGGRDLHISYARKPNQTSNHNGTQAEAHPETQPEATASEPVQETQVNAESLSISPAVEETQMTDADPEGQPVEEPAQAPEAEMN